MTPRQLTADSKDAQAVRYRTVRGPEGMVEVDVEKARKAMKHAMSILRAERRKSDLGLQALPEGTVEP